MHQSLFTVLTQDFKVKSHVDALKSKKTGLDGICQKISDASFQTSLVPYLNIIQWDLVPGCFSFAYKHLLES